MVWQQWSQITRTQSNHDTAGAAAVAVHLHLDLDWTCCRHLLSPGALTHQDLQPHLQVFISCQGKRSKHCDLTLQESKAFQVMACEANEVLQALPQSGTQC